MILGRGFAGASAVLHLEKRRGRAAWALGDCVFVAAPFQSGPVAEILGLNISGIATHHDWGAL